MYVTFPGPLGNASGVGTDVIPIKGTYNTLELAWAKIFFVLALKISVNRNMPMNIFFAVRILMILIRTYIFSRTSRRPQNL